MIFFGFKALGRNVWVEYAGPTQGISWFDWMRTAKDLHLWLGRLYLSIEMLSLFALICSEVCAKG